MEESLGNNATRDRGRGILETSSANYPRKTRQSISLLSPPRNLETRYRVCTEETYELAQVPTATTTSALGRWTKIRVLSDRGTDISSSSTSAQIQATPYSATSSAFSGDILGFATDIDKPTQLFKPANTKPRISLISFSSEPNKSQIDRSDIPCADLVLHHLLRMASKSADRTQLLQLFGMNDAWGAGPDFSEALFSVFDLRFLEMELATKSMLGEVTLKHFALGFDTNLFSRMERIGGNISFYNAGNCFKGVRMCPYRVEATRESLQRYIDQMIFTRKKAWTELCGQLHSQVAESAPGTEFEQVAAAFFGGKAVPASFEQGLVEDTKLFQITIKTGDRTKVLNMDPLKDDSLVLFLQDCTLSNALAKAMSKKLSFFNMVVSEDPNRSMYDAMLKIEEDTSKLKQFASSDGDGHGDEASRHFAQAEEFKKLLHKVPGAFSSIETSGESSLPSRGVSTSGSMSGLNALGISGLGKAIKNGSSAFTKAHSQNTAQNSTVIGDAASEATAAAKSKAKKKKKNKKKKKPATQPQPDDDDQNIRESTPDNLDDDEDTNDNSMEDKPTTNKKLVPEAVQSRDAQLTSIGREIALENSASTFLEGTRTVTARSGDQGWMIVPPKGNQKRGGSHPENLTRSFQTRSSFQSAPQSNLALTSKKSLGNINSTFSKIALSRNDLRTKTTPKSKLTPSTSENNSGPHSSVTEKLFAFNNNGSKTTSQSPQDYDQRFPPMAPKTESINPLLTEKRLKIPLNNQKSRSVPESIEVQNGARNAVAANLLSAVVSDPISPSSRRDEGMRVVRVTKNQQDVAITSTFALAATLNGRSSAHGSVLQQPSLGHFDAHQAGFNVLHDNLDIHHGQLRTKEPQTNVASISLAPDTSSVSQPELRSLEIDGQHSVNNGSVCLDASPSALITIKNDSDTQIQSSISTNETAHLVLKNSFPSEPWKRVEFMRGAEIEPGFYGNTISATCDEIWHEHISSKANHSTSHEDALSSSVVGQEAESNILVKVDDTSAGFCDSVKSVSTSSEEGNHEACMISDPLAWADLSNPTKLRNRRYSLRTARKEFEINDSSTGTRSHSEEDRNRIRYSNDNAPISTLSMILNDDNQDMASDNLQIPMVEADDREHLSQFQYHGNFESSPRVHSGNFLPFSSVQQAYNPGASNTMLPPWAPISSSANNKNIWDVENLGSQSFHSSAYNFGSMMATANNQPHPMAGLSQTIANSRYLAPSNRNPSLDNTQRVVAISFQIWNCTFCKVNFHPTSQFPASFCPFCVNQGVIVYCSTACQLADSYNHCASCQHNTSYERMYTPAIVPDSTHRIETYPIKGLSYYQVIPECFRQKTFSMFCRTGRFPEIMGLWKRFRQMEEIEIGPSEDINKHTGDYFIFRSSLSTGNPSHPPVDVICTITLDPRDAMKLPLRRVLNACYIQAMPPFTTFLFRLLHYVIADYNIFNIMTSITAYASQHEIVEEFIYQFSREFCFPSETQRDQHRFDFAKEWALIEPRLEQFEQDHSILRYWKARDTACQLWWN